ERLETLAQRRLAGNRERPRRTAMKRPLERDQSHPLRPGFGSARTRRLQRRLHCLCPTVAKEDSIEPANLAQFFSQRALVGMEYQVGRVNAFLDLLVHDGQNPWMRIAE